MKNGMVYVDGTLVDSIVNVPDDYTVEEYVDECKGNGCDWGGEVKITWWKDNEEEA